MVSSFLFFWRFLNRSILDRGLGRAANETARFTFDHDVDEERRQIHRLSGIVAQDDVPVAGAQARHRQHPVAQQPARVFVDGDAQAGQLRQHHLEHRHRTNEDIRTRETLFFLSNRL